MARYKEAIEWIALKDDNSWTDTIYFGVEQHYSPMLRLVADIFGKTREQARADLVKQLQHNKSYGICLTRDIPDDQY
jgi:hypothetical protein